MVKTADGFRARAERRKKSRRMDVMLGQTERLVLVYWYEFLLSILHRRIRARKVKTYVVGRTDIKNPDFALPIDAVRQELRHIFYKDWKCSLGFNDIDKQIHMRDLR